ncbi:hypothetical protein [Cellulomonas sp. NPDC089187]|uniref:hypothetical protein n=1 Tax=Cellulomonas sp. NPDC089187 TaxID=3154970 RepID=UPI00342DD1FB
MRPRATFLRLLRAEWIRLWSLPWTGRVCAGVVVVQTAFTTVLAATANLGALGYSPHEVGPNVINSAYPVGQLAMAVLGVLAVTGEYDSGAIRSTFAAAPRRTGVILARALVLAVTAGLTGLATTLATWAALTPSLTGAYAIDPRDPTHLRMLAAMPLYLIGIALFACAIGWVVRRTGAALGLVLAVFLVVDTLAMMLQRIRVVQILTPFLPSASGTRLLTTDTGPMLGARDVVVLGPWQGWGVLIAWAVALGTAAVVLVRRRDV